MLNVIQEQAQPFKTVGDLDPVIHKCGHATYVLLGESSHGTSEFYDIRKEISKKLISEKGFSFIAVEGDWPDCQRINRYIKGYDSTFKSAREVLEGFDRWPAWMWANQEMIELLEWLKDFNSQLEDKKKVGFYGLDVYSLWESMDEIIQFLEKRELPGLETARKAFSCFEPFNRSHESYAVSAGYFSENCFEEAIKLLSDVRKNKWMFEDHKENSLNMEVNALVTANAEEYYRSMVLSDADSWNVRDEHMVEVLEVIMEFHGDGAKAIVWEHNTHVGDARATDMSEEGMVNVGQLLRERHGSTDIFIVGFGTFTGSVIASTEWRIDYRVTKVPPAQIGSWEYLMHETGAHNKFLLFTDENREDFNTLIGHRAIGVVYNPQHEHLGNYVPSFMGRRYDCFIYFDKTTALHPLIREKALY